MADGLYFISPLQNEISLAWIDRIGETETVSNSEQTCDASFAIIRCTVPGGEVLSPAFWLRDERFLRSRAIMKVALKPIIEALRHDGNQLEHHARKLRTISPNLEAEAEEIDDRVASIRKQVEMLEQWE
jgi:hypothetical protein